MTVCTMTAMDEVHTAHIRVFSRFALLDCTGLSASVRTKRMINNDRYVYVMLSIINTYPLLDGKIYQGHITLSTITLSILLI